jgi:hypothetical protein
MNSANMKMLLKEQSQSASVKKTLNQPSCTRMRRLSNDYKLAFQRYLHLVFKDLAARDNGLKSMSFRLYSLLNVFCH